MLHLHSFPLRHRTCSQSIVGIAQRSAEETHSSHQLQDHNLRNKQICTLAKTHNHLDWGHNATNFIGSTECYFNEIHVPSSNKLNNVQNVHGL